MEYNLTAHEIVSTSTDYVEIVNAVKEHAKECGCTSPESINAFMVGYLASQVAHLNRENQK